MVLVTAVVVVLVIVVGEGLTFAPLVDVQMIGVTYRSVGALFIPTPNVTVLTAVACCQMISHRPRTVVLTGTVGKTKPVVVIEVAEIVVAEVSATPLAP